MTIQEEIKSLAKDKNAIILAHNYQIPEIQDVADLCGDSLQLAQTAASTEADIIVLCGVHFMAESAAMLAPEKTVLIPEPEAGCPLADMALPEDLIEMKEQYPKAAVVTYINSSAEIKALSDIICTSSNALKIVNRIEEDTIIFVPDKNLGHWVQRFTDKKIIPWQGFCPTHEYFTPKILNAVKGENPNAVVMVHPECPPEIIEMADEVFSTGQMVSFVKKTDAKEIIVGTEIGMIHKLQSENPDIKYIPVDTLICPNMKKNSLEKLRDSLSYEKTRIQVKEDVAENSRKALERMLELSY